MNESNPMTPDAELQVQALVDGQLTEADAARVEAMIERDPELRRLRDALRTLSGVLTDNEWERPSPDSADFYWSRVESGLRRAAAREEAQAEAPKPSGKLRAALASMREEPVREETTEPTPMAGA